MDAVKPGERDTFIWDEDLPGFGLKVTPTGRKVFLFQYRIAIAGLASRTPPGRYTIGPLGEWTPVAARLEAERLARLAAQGIDPLQERRSRIAAAETARNAMLEQERLEGELKFEVFAERWLASLVEEGKSPGYYKTSRWIVRHYLAPALNGKPLPHITPDDVQAAIDSVSAAKRESRLATFDTAFAIFKWAKGTKGGKVVPRNIVEDVDRPKKPKSRDRVLNDCEVAAVWKASDSLPRPWPSFYRLAILTGKRRGEVARMDWAELNRSAREWRIPGNRGSKTKNDAPDLIPLSDNAIAELDALAGVIQKRAGLQDADVWPKSGPVLTGGGQHAIGNFGKVKRLLDAQIAKLGADAPMVAWTVHDLRRTFATGMQRIGVKFEVTEALLNHTGRARGGVAGVYQRHDWKAEKRAALDRWALHITQIVAAAGAENVISLEALRA